MDIKPYLGALAVLPVGWLVDLLPGIRVDTLEYLGFTAAAVLAAHVARGSSSSAL